MNEWNVGNEESKKRIMKTYRMRERKGEKKELTKAWKKKTGRKTKWEKGRSKRIIARRNKEVKECLTEGRRDNIKRESGKKVRKM